MQDHIRPLQQFHGLADLRQLQHLLQRRRVQRIRQVDQPVMSAQLARNLFRQRVGLCFHRPAETAPGRHHHDVQRCRAPDASGHRGNRPSAGHRQRIAVYQDAPQTCRADPAHIGQHLLVLVRVAGSNQHPVCRQQLAQPLFCLRQATHCLGEGTGGFQHLFRLAGQGHAGSVQVHITQVLQDRRRVTDLPLRQVQLRGQLAPAHRLQRRDPFQNQGPSCNLVNQIGSKFAHQGNES